MAVAVFIFRCEAPIFVEIHGVDSRKVQLSRFIELDQLFIAAKRGGAGRESKNGIRLLFELLCHKLCGFFTQLLIIFCYFQ